MAGNLLTVRRKLPRWIYLLAVTAKRHEIRSEGFLTYSKQVNVHYVATVTPL